MVIHHCEKNSSLSWTFTTLNSEGNKETISRLQQDLDTKEYDTEALLDDISEDMQSNLHNFCVEQLNDKQLYHSCKQSLLDYFTNSRCKGFKDIDFAISKYYSLMGIKDNVYFNKHHIGLLEVFCFHNGYLREAEIESELNKSTIDTVLSKFDLK